MGEKAKYYKCALQVNSFSYAKYRGNIPQDELEYNRQILERCQANDISVVGLADHGSVDSSASLRTCLQYAGIMVFPGFEISSAEKIHMVCIFPPEYDTSKLNRIIGGLGLANVEKGTEASEKTCLDIAAKIEENGGFWYAAHITGDNGILKLGKMQHIWKDKRLVAAQIPASREEIDPSYVNIINNTDLSYKREHMPAYINARDVETPEDLDKETASVLVKMSSPNFKNFCMAFKDPESRIRLNSERENNYQSSINKVKVSGGYLDGLSLELSENLATIIGGRGTGKSTLIGVIRYALGKTPASKDSAKDFESMLAQNLASGGIIELTVTSNVQHGQQFVIKRRYKQEPVITTTDGTVSPLTVSDILPSIEIYGQNEIMEIARDELKIHNVAERLFSIPKKLLENMGAAHEALVENSSMISGIEQQLKAADTSLEELPSIQAKLKYYTEAGLDDKLAIFRRLSSEEGQFNAIQNSLNLKTTHYQKITVGEYQNLELIAISQEIEDFNSKVDELNSQYDGLLKKLKQSFSDHKKKWEDGKSEYDDQLKQSLKSMEGVQDMSSQDIVDEYSDLVKKAEECKPLAEKQNRLKAELSSAEESRATLIENYKTICDERDRCLKQNVKRINRKKLCGTVRLDIKFRQNKKKLLDYLTSHLIGVGEKSISGIAEYDDFDVFTFANNCRQGADKLIENYGLTKRVADTIVSTLTGENLRIIEEMELEDIVEIELNVNGKFKKLKDLSKGQQCTAILNLLLLDNKDPLIIDQPEDNLDNSFIAENLVKTLRSNKIKRQYILATHNANIPVFGDAEQIITMEEEEGNGRIAIDGLGSIDDQGVKEKVIGILEGGPDAFRMREEKYGI